MKSRRYFELWNLEGIFRFKKYFYFNLEYLSDFVIPNIFFIGKKNSDCRI